VRTCIAAVLALAALLWGTSPALGESWHGHDTARDARSFLIDASGRCATVTTGAVAPADARRDVVRLGVDHGEEAVELTLNLRDVARRDRETTYEFVLRTPERLFIAVAFPGRRLRPALFAARAVRRHDCGRRLTIHLRSCDGLLGDADAGSDRVTISVPRSCVGEPRWVRVGAVVSGAIDERSGDESIRVDADAWGGRGLDTSKLVPPLGPRVRVS